MGELVDVQREGAVARVAMHRKGNNSIAEDLLVEVGAAFESLGSDPEVRVVVLASAYEKYFSVGYDLTTAASVERNEEAITQATITLNRHFDRIAGCPKPVIAAINGHALGGGCELALCCDYRLMAEDARSRIGLPEASLGIMPGGGGTQRLPRLIGKALALPMILEGRRLSAREAEAVGLVNQAVAPEQLEGAVAELAGRLAKAATYAIGLMKDAVNRGLDLPLEEGLKIEARNFARASLSEDAVIGVTSFLMKQEPQFKGR